VPPLELAFERVALPEVADRPTEEGADLPPAAPEQAAGERQHRVDVEVPERAGRTTRDTELERGDEATGAYHANELGQRGARVGDVAQQIGKREVVEGLGRKRERLR